MCMPHLCAQVTNSTPSRAAIGTVVASTGLMEDRRSEEEDGLKKGRGGKQVEGNRLGRIY